MHFNRIIVYEIFIIVQNVWISSERSKFAMSETLIHIKFDKKTAETRTAEQSFITFF